MRKIVQIRRNEADESSTYIYPRTVSEAIAIGKNYLDKWGTLDLVLFPKNDAYENYALRLGKELMFAVNENSLAPLKFDFAAYEEDGETKNFTLDKLSDFSIGSENAYWKDLFVHDKVILKDNLWINKLSRDGENDETIDTINVHTPEGFFVNEEQWFSGPSDYEYSSIIPTELNTDEASGFITDIKFGKIYYEEGNPNKQILPVNLNRKSLAFEERNTGEGWDADNNKSLPGAFIYGVSYGQDAENPYKIILIKEWRLVTIDNRLNQILAGNEGFLTTLSLEWDPTTYWRLVLDGTREIAAVFGTLKIVYENGLPVITSDNANEKRLAQYCSFTNGNTKSTVTVVNTMNTWTRPLHFVINDFNSQQAPVWTVEIDGEPDSNNAVSVTTVDKGGDVYGGQVDVDLTKLGLRDARQKAIDIYYADGSPCATILIKIREALEVTSTTSSTMTAAQANENGLIVLHNEETATFNAGTIGMNS